MRILRILPAALAIGVGTAGLVATPAHASITSPTLTATTFFSHASTCSSTVTGGTSNATFSDDGNAVTTSQSSSGTIANGSDTTAVSAAGKGTVKVTRSGSSLATADFTATASAKATPASSTTACSAFSEGYTSTSFGFSIAHAGWLTVTTSGDSSGYAFSAIYISGTNTGSYVQTFGARMIGSNRIFLPRAGSYAFSVQYGAEAAASSTTTPKQSSLALKVHAAYTIAGGASGPASGGGATYVRMANARDCTSNNVAATFTGNANKVKTAAFYINGSKKKTVQHPSSGTSVLVGGLADSASVTYKAVLTLKAGGTSTVSRSYLPCS